MDAWLSNLNASAPKSFINAERTQSQVIGAKPASIAGAPLAIPAVDLCYLTGDTTFSSPVFDFSVCDQDPRPVPHASPRQVAGGPRLENILKCQLKPLNFADYVGITFTASQQARLQTVFSSGVCDWSKPGVGQQAAQSPLDFSAGPGGVPLPPAPSTQAFFLLDNVSVTAVPEPPEIALMAAGLAFVLGTSKRRRVRSV